MKKSYFESLNLKPPANEEEIKQAYRILAKQYHPDVNPDPDAHEKFLEISEAYEYLLEEAQSSKGRIIYDHTDIDPEYFEEMRRVARERAQERTRMRFEKMQKEHEAFQESGLYDFVLLANYIGRYALLLLCGILIVWPLALSFYYTDTPYAVRAMMLFGGGVGLYLILKAGKSYFLAGTFYYTFSQIKKVFTFNNPDSQERCFYNPDHPANSRPYKINMIKIKDIKLQNYGPGQHSVAFNQKSVTVDIPRSHQALIVHSVLIVLKISILLYCIFFLGISSILWRIIIALFISVFVAHIILLITKTKSTSSFLATTGLFIRITIWFGLIVIFSVIQLRPFNIFASENMYGLVVFMLFFDSFLDQFLNYISRKRFRTPIFKQHPLVESYLEKKYQFGYDMPVFSVFYPFYKWFLG